METFYKNEFWMLIFSFGLLYWLFNPSLIMTLTMIIPLLLGVLSKNATVNVTVLPVNDVPVFQGTPLAEAREMALYTFDLNVTDADGDQLSFAFSEAPSWLTTLDLGDGVVRISGIPPFNSRGDANVTIIANDGQEGMGSLSYVFTVLDGLPPVITLKGDSFMQIPFGEQFTDPGFTANDDSDGDLTEKVTVSGAVNSGTAGCRRVSPKPSHSRGWIRNAWKSRSQNLY